MAEPLTPTKPVSLKIPHSSSAFLFTISASLLSFSIYFLSFKDTTFWFFLSNAIICLIAAADSESANRSKCRPDIYDEYLKRTTRVRPTYAAAVPDSTLEEKKYAELHAKDATVVELSCVGESHNANLAIVAKEVDSSQDDLPLLDSKPITTVDNHDEDCVVKECVSELDKAIIAVIDNHCSDKKEDEKKKKQKKKKKVLRRSETENGRNESRRDNGDFSSLSNEELNRRVEEFIRNFNREIWLQEMRE